MSQHTRYIKDFFLEYTLGSCVMGPECLRLCTTTTFEECDTKSERFTCYLYTDEAYMLQRPMTSTSTSHPCVCVGVAPSIKMIAHVFQVLRRTVFTLVRSRRIYSELSRCGTACFTLVSATSFSKLVFSLIIIVSICVSFFCWILKASGLFLFFFFSLDFESFGLIRVLRAS